MRYGMCCLPVATIAAGLIVSPVQAQTQPPVPAGQYQASWLCGSRHFDAEMDLQADGQGLFTYFTMSGDGKVTSGSYHVRVVREGNDVLIQPHTWVKRDADALMYPARVRISEDRMEGSVDAPSCAFLTLKRADGARIVPVSPIRQVTNVRFPGPPPLTFANTPISPAGQCRADYLKRGRTWAEVLAGMNSWADRSYLYDSYVRIMQVASAEQRYRDVLACRDAIRADTGQALVDQPRVDDWNRTLIAAAQTFFVKYRALIEHDLAIDTADRALAEAFESSRTLSALGGTALADGKTKRKARLDAEALAKANAARAAAEKQAALAALTPTIGPWRKTDTFEYARQAPAGITVKLYCDTAGGLGIMLGISNGYFINPSAVKYVTTADLALTTRSGRSLFKAPLGFEGSNTSTGYQYGRETRVTTTYYDPRRASFAMNVPARRGVAAQRLLEAAGRAGTTFAEAIGAGSVADEDNPMLLLMRGAGQLTAADLQANTINFADIATVRNEPSLKLSVQVFGRGMVDLFDLEPTRAPFAILMKACN